MYAATANPALTAHYRLVVKLPFNIITLKDPRRSAGTWRVGVISINASPGPAVSLVTIKSLDRHHVDSAWKP